MADRIALLVELDGGETVAVLFDSAEKADHWEESIPYEVVGRPRIVTARSLSIGAREKQHQNARCRCDGGSYGVREHPFIVHPECPIHGTPTHQATDEANA